MSSIKCYEGASAVTPPSGVVVLYAKTDGRWYFKADDGVEYAMRPEGAGTGDLKADGSVPLTADWDMGSFSLTMETLTLDVADGTAPMVITSTTLVANLNADLLDGNEATAFATAAQGSTADTAVQPGALGTAAAEDVGYFATAAQGTTADTALQPADVDANASVKSNLAATVAPTVNEDSDDGYGIGSKWVDVTGDKIYFAVDVTVGAAIWQEVGSGTGGGGLAVEFKTASFTAEAGKKYFIQPAAAVAITMPAGVAADNILFLPSAHNAGTYNITITPDGTETIDDDTEFVINQNEGFIEVGYNDGDSNWEVSAIGVPSLVNVNDFATGFSATNPQTGTTYTFLEADLTKCVTANNAAASTYDIPDDLAVDGETLSLYNKGAGTVTITVAGSDTLSSTANTCPQYDAITILCEDGDTWYVIGGS